MFGLIKSITSAAVKTAILPVTVAADAVNIIAGDKDGSYTQEMIESIGDDIDDMIND